LESRLAQVSEAPKSQADESRIRALEGEFAKLTHQLDQISETIDQRFESLPASPAPQAPTEVVEVTEAPEVAAVPEAKPVVPAEPEAVQQQAAQTPPPPSESRLLERDVVDDWMTLPEVLVTRPIGASKPAPVAKAKREASPPNRPSSHDPAPRESQYDHLEEPPYQAEYEDDYFEAPAVEAPAPATQAPAPEPVAEAPAPVAQAPVPEPVAEVPAEAPPQVSLPESKEFFRLMMQQIKENDIRLHAVLADARLSVLEPGRFELSVPAGYEWHFGKIQEGKKLLESVAEQIAPGANLQMECCIGGEKAAPPKENEHEELVKRASGVFGGSSIID